MTRTGVAQLGAYLLIVVTGLIGFTALDREADKRINDREVQIANLCDQAQINRDALRTQAKSTADLGRNLVSRNPTPETLEDALAIIDAFEKKQLEFLDPIDCPRVLVDTRR